MRCHTFVYVGVVGVRMTKHMVVSAEGHTHTHFEKPQKYFRKENELLRLTPKSIDENQIYFLSFYPLRSYYLMIRFNLFLCWRREFRLIDYWLLFSRNKFFSCPQGPVFGRAIILVIARTEKWLKKTEHLLFAETQREKILYSVINTAAADPDLRPSEWFTRSFVIIIPFRWFHKLQIIHFETQPFACEVFNSFSTAKSFLRQWPLFSLSFFFRMS